MDALLATSHRLVQMANTEEIQPFFWVILFVTYLFALWLIFRLWKKPDTTRKRLLWTVLLLFPFLGPIFYGGFHRPPKVQPEHMRAKKNIAYGGG